MRVGGLKVISFTVASTVIQLFQKTPNKIDFSSSVYSGKYLSLPAHSV